MKAGKKQPTACCLWYCTGKVEDSIQLLLAWSWVWAGDLVMGAGKILSNMMVYSEMYLAKSGRECYIELLCSLIHVGLKGAGTGK